MTKVSESLDAEKPNRMERRRLKTRDKLLAATLELMVAKGVDKTTMDDITNLADLGRRTFYYHFSSKEECVVAAAAGAFQRHSQAVADRFGEEDDPARVLATATQLVIPALVKEAITAQLTDRPRLLGQALGESIGPFVREDIQAGVEQGRFKPPLTGEAMDNLILGALVVLVIEIANQQDDMEELVRGYAQTFLMMLGIGAEEAGKLVKEAS